jgi:hypothetical protein
MFRFPISAVFQHVILFLLIASGLTALAPVVRAQSPWASEVVAYEFGGGQTFGQDSAYFPANVLGPVAPGAGPMAPASSPYEVVSLGRGGWVTLGFSPRIQNEAGADFSVFENVLVNQVTGQPFTEWMIVAVSQTGDTWHTFPYDTATGAGMAGRAPTAKAPVDYQNPAESGGDSFDLDKVGLEWARYVRLTDATRYQPPDRLAAELDAVVAVHQKATHRQPQALAKARPRVWTRRSGERAILQCAAPLRQLRLVNMKGQTVHRQAQLAPQASAQLPELAAGVYVLQAQSSWGQLRRKIWLP